MGQLAPVFYIIAKETADRQDDSQILAGVNQTVDRLTDRDLRWLLVSAETARCETQGNVNFAAVRVAATSALF